MKATPGETVCVLARIVEYDRHVDLYLIELEPREATAGGWRRMWLRPHEFELGHLTRAPTRDAER